MKKITLQGIHLTPPAVVEDAPVYSNAGEYDPVLRDHCRMHGDERLFPAAAVRRPGRGGAVRIL